MKGGYYPNPLIKEPHTYNKTKGTLYYILLLGARTSTQVTTTKLDNCLPMLHMARWISDQI